MPTNLEVLLAFMQGRALIACRLCSTGNDLYSYFTRIATRRGSEVQVMPENDGESGTVKRHRRMLRQLLEHNGRREVQDV